MRPLSTASSRLALPHPVRDLPHPHVRFPAHIHPQPVGPGKPNRKLILAQLHMMAIGVL